MRFIRVGTYNNSICLSTIDDSDITLNPSEKIKEIDLLKNLIANGIQEDTFKYLNDNIFNNNEQNNISMSNTETTITTSDNNSNNNSNNESLNSILNNKKESNLYLSKTIYHIILFLYKVNDLI